MVANVKIEELNTGSETPTNKTSGTVRFKNADDAVVDTNDRLIIPTSDTEYSFRKMLRLRLGLPADTDVTNLNAYTDGTNNFQSPVTRVKVWYAVKSGALAFSTPTVPLQSEDPPEWPSDAAMSDLFTATSGTPIDLDGFTPGPYTSGSIQIGDYLGLVMEVEKSAVQGTLSPAETLTFSFDET